MGLFKSTARAKKVRIRGVLLSRHEALQDLVPISFDDGIIGPCKSQGCRHSPRDDMTYCHDWVENFEPSPRNAIIQGIPWARPQNPPGDKNGLGDGQIFAIIPQKCIPAPTAPPHWGGYLWAYQLGLATRGTRKLHFAIGARISLFIP